MGKKVASNLFLALTVLVLASLACQSLGGGDSSSPTEESQSGPANPTPVTSSDSTEAAPAETGGAYDGSWTGTNTVDGKEILFTVENNQIVSVALNYTGEANGCDYHGAISTGVETGGIDPVVLDGDSFTAVVKSVNDELTFAGTFTSDSEASGTLLVKSPSTGLCGEYEKEVTWTATKGSGTDAQSTEDTSGFVSPEDSAAIVNGFFDAVNAGDLDTAIGFVDENVMFSLGTEPVQFGSDNLKTYLSSSGLTFEVSDIQSFGGGMAQFKATASDGTTYSFCNVVLTDGKIVSLSLQP